MITRIHHTGILVNDIEKLLPFYCDVLGMEVAQDVGILDGSDVVNVFGGRLSKVRIVMLRKGDQILEFIQPVEPPGKPLSDDIQYGEVGQTHLALQVDNVESAYKSLAEKGARFICAPQENAGDMKFFYLRDPEGHYLEIFQPPS